MGQPSRPVVIAENQTAGDIFLSDIGQTVPASGTYTLSDFLYLYEIQGSKSLYDAIDADELLLNDGVTTLTKAQSLNFATGVASAQDLQNGVVGPATSTNNAVPKFSGSDGKTLVSSPVLIDSSDRLNMVGAKIINVASPTDPGDAVTKAYADSIASGLDPKESCHVKAPGNIVLSGLQTIDGELLTAGQRVLAVEQTTFTEDGIYVAAVGAWSRTADFPLGSNAASAFVFVEAGLLYADTGWLCSNNTPAVVGTDDITFVQFTSFALASTPPLDVDKSSAVTGVAGTAARADHKHDVLTAAPEAVGLSSAPGEGVATTLARSDHTHAANVPPVDTTKSPASIGTSGEPARADHKHDVSTAAPAATGVSTAGTEGTASTLARSDHSHVSNTAPATVTKATAAIGTSGEPARADHKHDVSTAAPDATGVSTASAEGSATTLARSDHSHASNTAPVAVTKAAAVIGTSGEPARADHKHDVTTAAPAVTGVSTASSEGTATTLARSDHSHQSNTAPVNITKSAAVIGTSGEPARADHKHDVTTAAPSTGIGAGNSEGVATTLARSDHDHLIRESGGQNLSLGAIADGEVIRRTGTTIAGGIGKVYPASATDPVSPSPAAGDFYFNTALNMQMYYDSVRSKWLSVETFEIFFGRNGDTNAGTFYRGADSAVMSSTVGLRAEHNGTIVSLSYMRSDSDLATFGVTADGTTGATLASSAVSGGSTTLNSNINAGQIIAVRNQAGGNITSNVQGRVRGRYRV